MITTTTQSVIKGKKYCAHCGGEIILCEKETKLYPRNYEPYWYMLEYSKCIKCADEYVFLDSIKKNEKRKKQAKLEASIAYKLKKWLNKE